MSSVPPRTTFKVRAFILSFHFGRKKVDHLLWLLAIGDISFCLVWYFGSLRRQTHLGCNIKQNKKNRKTCREQQTHRRPHTDTHKKHLMRTIRLCPSFCLPWLSYHIIFLPLRFTWAAIHNIASTLQSTTDLTHSMISRCFIEPTLSFVSSLSSQVSVLQKELSWL